MVLLLNQPSHAIASELEGKQETLERRRRRLQSFIFASRTTGNGTTQSSPSKDLNMQEYVESAEIISNSASTYLGSIAGSDVDPWEGSTIGEEDDRRNSIKNWQGELTLSF